MSSPEEVLEFLKKWKEALKNNTIEIVPREKNISSMKKMKIWNQLSTDILYNLELKNYSSGPVTDESIPDQDVWIFGFDFLKYEIYIKIKIYFCQGMWQGKCISLHEAEKHLSYPFRKNK